MSHVCHCAAQLIGLNDIFKDKTLRGNEDEERNLSKVPMDPTATVAYLSGNLKQMGFFSQRLSKRKPRFTVDSSFNDPTGQPAGR